MVLNPPTPPSRSDNVRYLLRHMNKLGYNFLSLGALNSKSMAQALLRHMLEEPLVNMDDNLIEQVCERVAVRPTAEETLNMVRLDMLNRLAEESKDVPLLDTESLLEISKDLLTKDYDGRFKLGFLLILKDDKSNYSELLMKTTDSAFALGSSLKELIVHQNVDIKRLHIALDNIYRNDE